MGWNCTEEKHYDLGFLPPPVLHVFPHEDLKNVLGRGCFGQVCQGRCGGIDLSREEELMRSCRENLSKDLGSTWG